jgi:dUTP pyrophosphatase
MNNDPSRAFAQKAIEKLQAKPGDTIGVDVRPGADPAIVTATGGLEPPGYVVSAKHPLEIFRLDKRARLPTRAHLSDVGWDIYSHLLTESGRDTTRMIPRYAASAIPTGLVVRPPPGYYCQVCSRSGWALQGVFVANAPGIIDPEYTGELTVILYNGSHETKWISHGMRVGQMVLAPIVPNEIKEITTPPTSEGRGAAGFGSSGY